MLVMFKRKAGSFHRSTRDAEGAIVRTMEFEPNKPLDLKGEDLNTVLNHTFGVSTNYSQRDHNSVNLRSVHQF